MRTRIPSVMLRMTVFFVSGDATCIRRSESFPSSSSNSVLACSTSMVWVRAEVDTRKRRWRSSTRRSFSFKIRASSVHSEQHVDDKHLGIPVCVSKSEFGHSRSRTSARDGHRLQPSRSWCDARGCVRMREGGSHSPDKLLQDVRRELAQANQSFA